jgi:hypothetical protein
VYLDCVPAFLPLARHAFAMLGLIAGYRVHFPAEPPSSPHLAYTSAAVLPAGAVRVPASAAAQAFLLGTGRFPSTRAKEHADGNRSVLSLFPADVPPGEGTAPDLIAAASYFLTLHGERSGGARDQFDRVLASDTLLGSLGMLDRPVLAEYAASLADLARSAGFPPQRGGRYAGRSTALSMTHDIDHLTKFTPGFAYRELLRLFLLNGAGVSLRARTRRLLEYLSAFLSRRNPPKESIRALLERERTKQIRATWFIKAGGRDKRDDRYSLHTRFMQTLFATLRADGHELGLHPGFTTSLDVGAIAEEARVLSAASGSTLRAVRQHYLRFRAPDTWAAQSEAGFHIDSTLGFAEQEGFRNGACHPFLVFDTRAGQPLPLWEIPLHVMDGTLLHYRGLDAAASRKRLTELRDIVSGHQGVFTVLVHNIIADRHDYPGWDAIFGDVTEAGSDPDVFCGTASEILNEWVRSAGYEGPEEVQKIVAAR